MKTKRNKGIIPFIIATERLKDLGVNLPKETKELYTENCKTLMKEIKDNINRWRDSPCSWVEGINIVKMTVLLNAIHRFSAIPIKLLVAFFTELEQETSQFICNHKRPQRAKAALRKKNGSGGINLPDFRLWLDRTSLVAQMVKCLPTKRETWV